MRSVFLICCFCFLSPVLFAQYCVLKNFSPKSKILYFLLIENQKDYVNYSGNVFAKVGGMHSSIFSILDADNLDLSKINSDQSLEFLNLANNYKKVIHFEFNNSNRLIYNIEKCFKARLPESAHCKIFFLLDNPLKNTYIVYFEYFYNHLYGAADVYKLKIEDKVVKVIDKKVMAIF